jgi:hypothetical protein
VTVNARFRHTVTWASPNDSFQQRARLRAECASSDIASDDRRSCKSCGRRGERTLPLLPTAPSTKRRMVRSFGLRLAPGVGTTGGAPSWAMWIATPKKLGKIWDSDEVAFGFSAAGKSRLRRPSGGARWLKRPHAGQPLFASVPCRRPRLESYAAMRDTEALPGYGGRAAIDRRPWHSRIMWPHRPLATVPACLRRRWESCCRVHEHQIVLRPAFTTATCALSKPMRCIFGRAESPSPQHDATRWPAAGALGAG